MTRNTVASMRRLLRDDRGATAAEYALIASLIAIVVVASVALLGTNLLGLYDNAASSLP